MSKISGRAIPIADSPIRLFVPGSDAIMQVVSPGFFFDALVCSPMWFEEPFLAMPVASITNAPLNVGPNQLGQLMLEDLEIREPSSWVWPTNPCNQSSCDSSGNFIGKSGMDEFVTVPTFPKGLSWLLDWAVDAVHTKRPAVPVSLESHVKIHQLGC